MILALQVDVTVGLSYCAMIKILIKLLVTNFQRLNLLYYLIISLMLVAIMSFTINSFFFNSFFAKLFAQLKNKHYIYLNIKTYYYGTIYNKIRI